MSLCCLKSIPFYYELQPNPLWPLPSSPAHVCCSVPAPNSSNIPNSPTPGPSHHSPSAWDSPHLADSCSSFHSQLLRSTSWSCSLIFPPWGYGILNLATLASWTSYLSIYHSCNWLFLRLFNVLSCAGADVPCRQSRDRVFIHFSIPRA